MSETAFTNAGKKPDLELWRVEDLKPVKQGKVDGKLHTGDSYILLSTKSKGGRNEYSIHFWLGAESSQDEQGVAAYKTVELDDALGGAAVQYRETQEHESPLFLSYFKERGIQYLPGGVKSGFNKVERDVYPTRLLRIKGSRIVRAKEVPLKASSLNTNDAFILDAGLKLYLWSGPQTNRAEKAKALELLSRIKDDERGGRAEVIVVNEDPHNADFWKALDGEIEVTLAGEADEEAEKARQSSISLSRVSDANGDLAITPVETPADGKLSKEMLDTSDVFILDVGQEIFLWIGKGTTAEEKKGGMRIASTFLEKSKRSPNTPITRVIESGETGLFKSFFKQWDPPRVLDFRFKGSQGVALPRSAQSVDVNSMLERVHKEEEEVDDGSGKLKIWRIENLERAEWPEEKYGHFYSGDSYVLLYTYRKGSKDEDIIYFWQGNASTADEKGASALHAVKLDDELGGRPVQVRVVQGKEPSHFRSLFKGKMVIHSGGAASGFHSTSGQVDDASSSTAAGPALYHIKGSTKSNTYAVQVPTAATSVNSGDCFVLVTSSTVFVWFGQASNEHEREVAGVVAENLKKGGQKVGKINETSEPDEFWEALGGRGDYAKTKKGEDWPKDARLFLLSNATGTMREIVNFVQADLIDDDVILLDTYSSVFIWVGSHANEEEKKQALKIAQEYISKAADARDVDTPIIKVASGSEPTIFTQHFIGWDPELASRNAFEDPYDAKLAKIKAEKAKQEQPGSALPVPPLHSTPPKPAAVEPPVPIPAPAPSTSPKKKDAAPPTPSPAPASSSSPAISTAAEAAADPTNREASLLDTEFQNTFQMSKADFHALPKWKQQAKKKEVGLF